jgi:nicotinate phosphoribosyltransferase
MVESAGGRAIIEFGTRRAQSPHAGVLAGRAAFLGGCVGTSNTLAGFRYGVPVFGTSAHSWVQAFPGERQAFEHLQKMLGSATVYLIDTYDTLEGARHAAALGRPLWRVRLDSGNLVELSRAVRNLLDHAGLHDAKIMASGDLNEYKILELVAAGTPIDAFGVGTELATSADAPSLGAVYKLAEVEVKGIARYTAKYSEDKHTWPGAKQVFRFGDHDVIARESECIGCPAGSPPVEALLRPVILRGRLLEPLPTAQAARDHASRSLQKLPAALHSLFPAEQPWPVEYSDKLAALSKRVRQSWKPEVGS